MFPNLEKEIAEFNKKKEDLTTKMLGYRAEAKELRKKLAELEIQYKPITAAINAAARAGKPRKPRKPKPVTGEQALAEQADVDDADASQE